MPSLRAIACAGAIGAALFAVASCELFFQPKESNATDEAGTGDGPSAGDGPGGDSANPQGTPPSCKDSPSAMQCGPAKNQDCCASSVVPKTTGFKRSFDNVFFTDAGHPADVSAIRLDVYEVTVGRFRKFVEAYPGSKPDAGAGKSRVNGDPGWSDPQGKMAADAKGVGDNVSRCNGSTWTTTAANNEALPINCVMWVEAYAFCIWDGGRLPTEAEWNLAAAGGAEQRVYPWTASGTSAISAANAVYATTAPSFVGSKSTAGDGFWKHTDLAGNVAEWTLDWSDNYQDPCPDCAAVLTQPTGTRIVRGGTYHDPPENLYTARRDSHDPLNFFPDVGIRCAREP